MSSDTNLNGTDIKTEIVVIGGGGAGLAAAVAAAENRADVVLLERENKPGGNSANAFGILAAESPVQKRLKIDAPRDVLFQIAVDYSHWRINPEIVHAFLDKSADTVQWLEEKGVTFNIHEKSRMHFKTEIPPTWHHADGHGAGIVRVLTDSFLKSGGMLLCDTRAEEIRTDIRDGKIEVLAVTNGKELKITTSSVIIATGGYGADKEMLRKHCRYYRESMTLKGFPNTGDGLRMAVKAGAATEGLGILQVEASGVPGEPDEIWKLAAQPNTLWVNRNGARYVDESGGSIYETANAHILQPDAVSYTLLDKAIKRNITEGKFVVDSAISDISEEINSSVMTDLLKASSQRGSVKIADTMEEIYSWIGVKPETLETTIKEYNSFCDQGKDPVFLKDPQYLMPLRTPPYYAIKCVPCILSTFGGIKINQNMEALDNKEDPIPGLFAAGIDTGGWEPETYSLFLMAPISGFLKGYSFGYALNSGRIAGENAAKYIS